MQLQDVFLKAFLCSIDVMMPNMDGFELLKALRGNPTTQAIPVILISAQSGESSIEGKSFHVNVIALNMFLNFLYL